MLRRIALVSAVTMVSAMIAPSQALADASAPRRSASTWTGR